MPTHICIVCKKTNVDDAELRSWKHKKKRTGGVVIDVSICCACSRNNDINKIFDEETAKVRRYLY